jgi:uncharacterized protein YpmB
MNGLIDTLIWVFVISLFSLGCLAVFIVIYAVIAVMIQDRKDPFKERKTNVYKAEVGEYIPLDQIDQDKLRCRFVKNDDKE